VGLDVVSNLTAIGIALAVRSEKNEKVYVDAFNSLRKMLCEHFNSYSEWKFCRCGLPWYCNKSCDDQLVAMKVPSKGFAYSELCSLPKSLDDAIKLIPPASDEVAI
jgi:hypothetical protein